MDASFNYFIISFVIINVWYNNKYFSIKHLIIVSATIVVINIRFMEESGRNNSSASF